MSRKDTRMRCSYGECYSMQHIVCFPRDTITIYTVADLITALCAQFAGVCVCVCECVCVCVFFFFFFFFCFFFKFLEKLVVKYLSTNQKIALKARSANDLFNGVYAMFFFFSDFIKAYVVGTHLNCIDKSMQFKWVHTTYAFINT